MSQAINSTSYITQLDFCREGAQVHSLWIPCPHPRGLELKCKLMMQTGMVVISIWAVGSASQNWLHRSSFPDLNQLRKSFHVHEQEEKIIICVMVL